METEELTEWDRGWLETHNPKALAVIDAQAARLRQLEMHAEFFARKLDCIDALPVEWEEESDHTGDAGRRIALCELGEVISDILGSYRERVAQLRADGLLPESEMVNEKRERERRLLQRLATVAQVAREGAFSAHEMIRAFHEMRTVLLTAGMGTEGETVMTFEARAGWSAFEGTDGVVWRYRSRGASGVVAITNVEGKRLYDATHNDAKGLGTSLSTGSRRRAAWFAMKGTLEGLPKAVKYPRAPARAGRQEGLI